MSERSRTPELTLRSAVRRTGALGSIAAQRAEERAEVRGEEAGLFEGEEVAAAAGACPLADVGVAAFGVLAGIVAVFGGQGDAGGNVDAGQWRGLIVVVVGPE